ncbi:sensor histidine kinase [Flavobacterium sp.]|uniref:sensor histidine kinase n=1 Tax=Flavobacterium sp. TaxID=239 RepID=UPI002FD8EF07
MVRFYTVLFFLFIFFWGKANVLTQFDSIEYYSDQKEFIKGINYAKNLSDKLLKAKKYTEYCKVSVRKSKLYGSLNDNERSLSVLFNALALAEKHKLNCKSEIIEQLGTRYSLIKDINKSFKYYFKAKYHALKEKDTSTLIHVYHNLFRLYTDTHLDSAKIYMKKKFELDKKTNNVKGICFSYNNHFVYYTLIGEPKTAKIYLDSTYNLAIKNKITPSIITVLSNLGYYYMEHEGNFKKGAETFEKIRKEYEKELTNYDQVGFCLNLVYAYEQLGDYRRANMYNTMAFEYNNELSKQALSDKTREIETKYQIDKVEQQYEEKSKLLEEKQNRNKKIIFIFIALFCFSLILFYFFYQNLQLKQRNKIKELDSEIQENIINASIDGQETERKKLAEILHDNISALLSSAGLHVSAFLVGKDNVPEELVKARSLLKEAHDKVRDLSHELVPPVLSKLGLFYATQDLCEKNSNSIIQFNFTNFGSIHKRYPEEFESKVYFIISELINNIVKHSEATLGYVTLEERNNQLILNIEDNGKGFDVNKYTSDGFGLTQIKARVKNLKGKITINSKLGAGTLLYIKLPIPEN